MHGLWLTEINLILQSVLAGSSPYAGAFVYNPEQDLDEVLLLQDDAGALIDIYNAGAWDDALDRATTAIDTVLIPDSAIQAEVDAQETLNLPAFLRGVGRMAAGMADAHSSLSSAFVFAMADMEADAARPLTTLAAQLRRDRYNQRSGLILQGTGQILDVLNGQIDGAKARANMRLELSKLTIATQTSRLEQELAYDVADATWDLSLFTQPGNLMASISGGIASAEHTPRSQQALSNSMGLLSALGPLVAAI
jgi:hypothetical protein